MTESPCQHCKERHLHCNSECKKYINYKDKHEGEIARVRANKDSETFITYGVERMRKIMRSKR